MLRKFLVVAACVCAPLVMGNTGCDGNQIPSTAQIEYHVPAELRDCPYAPSSPGRTATAKQRAAYISGLYYAWEQCHGNLAQRDALYAKYRTRIEAFQNSGN